MTPEDLFVSMLEIIDDELIDELISMEYRDYLRSEYWAIIRDYLFFIRGCFCEFCGLQPATVHHVTYKYRNLGLDHEHLEYLYLVCTACHQKIHIEVGEGNIIYLGDMNINDFWTVFISEEKDKLARLKYIETKQKYYLKAKMFLDFIIANKHLSDSNIDRQFHPK